MLEVGFSHSIVLLLECWKPKARFVVKKTWTFLCLGCLSLYKEEIHAEQIDTDVQGMFSYGKYILIFTLNIVDDDERCVHGMADTGIVKLME